MCKFYWIRIGDPDYYQYFDSPWEAGYEVGNTVGVDGRAIIQKRDKGIEILNTEFMGNNYISLYRGGLKPNSKSYSLTKQEFNVFMDGYAEGWSKT